MYSNLAVDTFLLFLVLEFSSANGSLVSDSKISLLFYSYYSTSSFFHYLNSHFWLKNSQNSLIKKFEF